MSLTLLVLGKVLWPKLCFQREQHTAFPNSIGQPDAINLIELALIEVDHSAADLNLYCECRFSVRAEEEEKYHYLFIILDYMILMFVYTREITVSNGLESAANENKYGKL